MSAICGDTAQIFLENAIHEEDYRSERTWTSVKGATPLKPNKYLSENVGLYTLHPKENFWRERTGWEYFWKTRWPRLPSPIIANLSCLIPFFLIIYISTLSSGIEILFKIIFENNHKTVDSISSETLYGLSTRVSFSTINLPADLGRTWVIREL